MSVLRRTSTSSDLAGVSRAAQRKERLLALEKQQCLEDVEALKMTEDQRQTLLRCFKSVKTEFTDLDGLCWTRSALRMRCHLPPTPPTPTITPPTPPTSHTRAFAVLTNADLASFAPEDTIRASRSRTSHSPSHSTPAHSPCLPNSTHLPNQTIAPQHQHRNCTRSRSPIKGLFISETPTHPHNGEAGQKKCVGESRTARDREEVRNKGPTECEQILVRGRALRPMGSRSRSFVDNAHYHADGATREMTSELAYAVGKSCTEDTPWVRSEENEFVAGSILLSTTWPDASLSSSTPTPFQLDSEFSSTATSPEPEPTYTVHASPARTPTQRPLQLQVNKHARITSTNQASFPIPTPSHGSLMQVDNPKVVSENGNEDVSEDRNGTTNAQSASVGSDSRTGPSNCAHGQEVKRNR